MSIFQRIDLSQLPAPIVVEQKTYEQILLELKTDLISRDPQLEAVLSLESEPLVKLLQVYAYRELLTRQRENLKAVSLMLAFAKGSDLDQIGANYGVPRLLIDSGNPSAIPPISPTYESDSDFKRRIQLSFEAFTTAGSEASYIFHGLSADGQVADITALSPSAGVVEIYVLARTGDGLADSTLLTKVENALNAKTIRPLTDNVQVFSIDVVNFVVVAELILFNGPDESLVLSNAQTELDNYLLASRSNGIDITISGLHHALHQSGVQKVNLISPSADVVVQSHQVANCTSTTLTVGGINA
ncbi:MAG: baseplate J/gp47 family protein [Moraxellaceae bacterium]|nr:baseplate J/gp47 family protein [Moraxellaceae bacterium]